MLSLQTPLTYPAKTLPLIIWKAPAVPLPCGRGFGNGGLVTGELLQAPGLVRLIYPKLHVHESCCTGDWRHCLLIPRLVCLDADSAAEVDHFQDQGQPL